MKKNTEERHSYLLLIDSELYDLTLRKLGRPFNLSIQLNCPPSLAVDPDVMLRQDESVNVSLKPHFYLSWLDG